MAKGITYLKATGKIMSVITASNTTKLELQVAYDSDLGMIEGDYSVQNNYVDITVDPVTIQTRADLSADFDALTVTAAGSSYITLSSLPIPCTVYVDQVATAVDDGSFEFDADAVGEYKIAVDELTFKRKEWIVNAN